MKDADRCCRMAWIAWVLSVPCLLAACGDGSSGGGDTGTDTDTDSDSDTDADTDSDTDTDTDADTNSDTGTESPTDTETDECVDGATESGSGGTVWVTICGGEFSMGTTALSYTQPVHSVTIPDFEMLETEVTVTQYAVCVAAAGCTEPSTYGGGGDCATTVLGNWGVEGREGHPVNCVSWQQAVDYCAWIGGRLPSESEREYAARSGGLEIDYPWGDETPTCECVVMNEGDYGCGTGHTMDVCSRPQGNTDQGLCDMAGNVWEWVQDWYHETYDGAPSDASAWEDPSGTFRVFRGGCFIYEDPVAFLSTTRLYANPSDQLAIVGFRCAR